MEVILMSEIQEIFNSLSPKSLSPAQIKVFYAIKNCRTPLLGKHINKCPNCDHTEILNNSCRNRHCPICQRINQEKWVQKQLEKLLPVPYFYVVFTLPDKLNTLMLQNQRLLYSLLIKATGDIITELSSDPKYLNAKVGVTSVLHTWGQNLSFHPHVHCIVPGGGITLDGLKLVTSSKKFFIPVRVLSSKFKGKFLFHLKNFFNENKLSFFNEVIYYSGTQNFQSLIDTTPYHVVNYLGRYTHRVAISDARIIGHDDESVSFKYKDYKDSSKTKTMRLLKPEFLRRFLLHVLPSGFTKIRHYGLLSSRNLKGALFKISKLCKLKTTFIKPKEIIKICPIFGHKINLLDISISKAFIESS